MESLSVYFVFLSSDKLCSKSKPRNRANSRPAPRPPRVRQKFHRPSIPAATHSGRRDTLHGHCLHQGTPNGATAVRNQCPISRASSRHGMPLKSLSWLIHLFILFSPEILFHPFMVESGYATEISFMAHSLVYLFSPEIIFHPFMAESGYAAEIPFMAHSLVYFILPWFDFLSFHGRASIITNGPSREAGWTLANQSFASR